MNEAYSVLSLAQRLEISLNATSHTKGLKPSQVTIADRLIVLSPERVRSVPDHQPEMRLGLWF